MYCAPEGLALGVMGMVRIAEAEERVESEAVAKMLRETDALGVTVAEPRLGVKVSTMELYSQKLMLLGLSVKMIEPKTSQGYR